MGLTAILIIVIIIQIVKYIAFTRKAMKSSSPSLLNRLAAAARACHYHRLRINNFYLPHTFPMLLITFVFVWTTAWAFATYPYYRAGTEWGSPPLGVRAGYMAQAMIPFVFALGVRVNPISFFTGISHERLQVYHQYGARIILFLSIVHTIPFIVQPYQQGYQLGGTGMARHFLKTYYDQTEQFWNGIPPFVALIWIVLSSMGYFRRLSYEFFVIQHIISTLFFFIWMFVHSKVSLEDGWYYLFVTVGVLVWSWFGRILWTFWANEYTYSSATIEALSENITRIRIITPLRWTPSQHVYIRFPTLNLFQSHPFTITSIPSMNKHSNTNVLQLLARGKRGISGKLFSKALSGQSSIPALVDGPYGGLSHPIDGYKNILLLSGGTGVNVNMGILLDLIRKMEHGQTNIEHIDFVWTVRSVRSLEWFDSTFRTLSTYSSFSNVNLVVHVTGKSEKIELSDQKTNEVIQHERKDSDNSINTKEFYKLISGRPNVKDVLRSSAQNSQNQDMAVVVCGPDSFNFDTMNEASAIELKIMAGDKSLPSRLFAHSENFEW